VRCQRCGRELTGLLSMIRKHGSTCWASHIDELPEGEREAAAMTGYKVKQIGVSSYIVTSPEANAYVVSLDPEVKCDCPCWSRHHDCKHIGAVLRHRGETPRQRSDDEIRAEIRDMFGD
jgi:hypothetical protein